jgi:hypothetical protein
MPPPDHRVRLRDGDREIEVTGNPAFVRQVLDDLPVLMARLRGEATGRTTISMPAPPPARAHDYAHDNAHDASGSASDIATKATTGDAQASSAGAANGDAPPGDPAASLEERVFDVLRRSTRPLAIAAIRKRLDGDGISGQQVRRLLEKAGAVVTVSGDRPATYSLR